MLIRFGMCLETLKDIGATCMNELFHTSSFRIANTENGFFQAA